jgi:hypothetical protein
MSFQTIFRNLGSTNGLDTILSGTFTIGAAGAITAQDGTAIAGWTAAKVAGKTGRYTLTFHRKFKRCKVAHANIVGDTDTAFGNTAANQVQNRNKSASSVDVQAFLSSSGADTELASGTVVEVTVIVSDT